MTPVTGEPRGEQALEVLTDLARDSVQTPSPVRLDRGLDALSVRIAAEKSRRTGWVRWTLAGATAAAAAAVILVNLPSQRTATTSAPLGYRIEGGTVGDGGYLRESGRIGIKLAFSEGTEFVLMPGTRGRLRTVDQAGARIAIEQGTASFQVTPREHAKWLVDVGPFLVTVTGTVFTVSWDATSERFDLQLRHGRVVVSGPISGGDISLRAGQRLVVNLPKAETLITEQKPDEAWDEAAPGTQPPAAAAPGERPAPRAAPDKVVARPVGAPQPSVAKSDDHRWAEALAAGRLDDIMAEVANAGVKTTLAQASSEDLFALATAARYRRRVDLARQALLAERRRFPTSERALDAAYLLGRVEESSERGTDKAIRWYDEYLARAPTGTYAAEALGRKMIVMSKLEGSVRAKPLAEEYLRRFPGGSYAGSARALLRAAP